MNLLSDRKALFAARTGNERSSLISRSIGCVLQNKCDVLAIGHECERSGKSLNIYRRIVIDRTPGMRGASWDQQHLRTGESRRHFRPAESFDCHLLHKYPWR